MTASGERAALAAPGGNGVPVGGRGLEGVAGREVPEGTLPLLAAVRAHETATAFIDKSDEFLAAQGLTEHGRRHAGIVSSMAHNVLELLGGEPRTAELAAVAGYLHDIGNVVTRTDHGQTGALFAYDIMKDLRVAPADMATVLGAIGNHEESYGRPVSDVSAAVILADKSDVHRSRVRPGAKLDADLHDRVNYAVTSSLIRVNATRATVTLELEIDLAMSSKVEYFEIFLERMTMCRRAAETLGCTFHITANGVVML